MRFFRRPVWRAIPELDGLSDERARAFVRATMKVGARRAVRWALIALTGVFTPYAVIVGYILIADLCGWWPARLGKGVDDHPALLGSMIGVGVLVWVTAVWSLRRWLVIRGVRMTLFRRGDCAKCGKRLSGLPMDDKGAVTCAGCGAVTLAEEGLGEVGDGVEPGRFAPRPDVRPSLLSFAGYRRRWVRNTAVLGVAVASLLSPVAWFEWSLARDAALARADRTSVAPLNALSRSIQPASSSWTDPNAWMKFKSARIRIEKTDKSVWDNEQGEKNANGLTRKPDFGSVGQPYAGQSGYAGEEDYLASVKLAEQMLPRYRRADVFFELATMRSEPRRDLQLVVDPEIPAMSVLVVQLKQAREMTRVNKARMAVAAREGDLNEFEDAFCTTLALSGMCAEHPSLVAMLTSCASDAAAFGQARVVLAGHPTAEWLDRIEAAQLRDRARPARSYAYKGERASALDTLAYAFTDRSLTRRRVFETRFGDYKGVRQRVGGYAENRRAIEEAFAVLIANADKPRSERSPGPIIREDLYYSVLLLSALDVAVRSFDQVDTERDGLRTMIVLERFRLQHGDYPEGLSELVPAHLSAQPVDVWSGKPLGYRRLTAEERSTDRQHRGYLLWSVGRDGVDDGGKATEAPGDRYAPFGSAKFAGFDFILNDTER